MTTTDPPAPEQRDDHILLSVAQVAYRLGVSSMTVRRLIDAGAMRAIRVGALYRITRRDLDAYLLHQATRPEEPGP